MVRITTTYRGELRTSAVHGPSGSELVTDAPVDNQGRGESFSPTDLVATALGSCMLTILGIAADARELSIEGATVDVKKSMVADPARRIGRLDVVVTIPGAFDEVQRAAFEKAALTCPVFLSLSDRIEVPVEFRWDA